jgi:hypothetical protein
MGKLISVLLTDGTKRLCDEKTAERITSAQERQRLKRMFGKAKDAISDELKSIPGLLPRGFGSQLAGWR